MSTNLFEEQSDQSDQVILNFIRNQLSAAKQKKEYQQLRERYEKANAHAVGGDFGTGQAGINRLLNAGQDSRAALKDLVTYVISVDPSAHMDR